MAADWVDNIAGLAGVGLAVTSGILALKNQPKPAAMVQPAPTVMAADQSTQKMLLYGGVAVLGILAIFVALKS